MVFIAILLVSRRFDLKTNFVYILKLFMNFLVCSSYYKMCLCHLNREHKSTGVYYAKTKTKTVLESSNDS